MHAWEIQRKPLVRTLNPTAINATWAYGQSRLPFVPVDAERKTRIAHAIMEARTLAGLTRSELARRVGVNPGAPRTWEKGLSVPNLLHLGPLCDALGVDADLFAHPPEILESPVRAYLLEREVKDPAEGYG